MSRYHWKGFVNGQRSEGDIDAIDPTQAKMLLAQHHVTVLELRELNLQQGRGGRAVKARRGRVDPEALLVLLKKMSSMVSAGLPVLEALKMLRDQATTPALLYLMEEIYRFVERGNPVSAAFARHPEVFDAVFVSLLRAGESSGRFDFFLQRLVVSVEKGIHIRKSIRKAMFYPTILLTVAVAVVTIMLLKVVPVFVEMYRGMGGELPAITAIVVGVSDWLRSPLGGGMLLLVVVLMGVGTKLLLRRSSRFRRRVQQLLMRLPLVGPLITQAAMSRIALVLGNLHVAGVSINQALDITADSIENLLVRDGLEQMKRGVLAGRSLSEMAAEQKVLPLEFSQLLAVGERTGQLGEMLEGMEKFYQEEFDNTIQNMTTLIEPVMIVFLGIVIGGILMAMYMPIFNMGQMM